MLRGKAQRGEFTVETAAEGGLARNRRETGRKAAYHRVIDFGRDAASWSSTGTTCFFFFLFIVKLTFFAINR